MGRIGVFGGSFNPPHAGHVQAAAAAREALGLERVLLIPAAVPPHKVLPAGSPDAAARHGQEHQQRQQQRHRTFFHRRASLQIRPYI